MQGFFGGIVTGGLVSALALSVASVVGEQPAGVTPPAPPLVDAPQVEDTPEAANDGPSTPVGSVSIDEPVAPDLPGDEGAAAEPASPVQQEADVAAPLADTAPLDEPDVVAIEGAMEAPAAAEGVDLVAEPVDPVLPNPQSVAPQVPSNEADLTVSTAPAAPVLVDEPEEVAVEAEVTAPAAPAPEVEAEVAVEAEAEGEASATPEAAAPEPDEDVFVVDLPQTGEDAAPAEDPVSGDDLALASPAQPRIQFQGQGNTLLTDRDTGVTVRRPTSDETAEPEAEAAAASNALVDYAASYPDPAGKPLMSVLLIDDGSMSAAAAALSGLPFPVTIVLDAARADAEQAMEAYRADGFEVAVMANLPQGAQPSDVEVTFESVFAALPEAIAVLDMGQGGLQSDREVTAQAMEILADQGRGFVTVSQGLNMAGRAAEQSGVPATTVYRDLDADGQDARVIRRFVDQAAFRARQETGVVLVGRVRPDTISALILWGTANGEDQVALVPLSAVLTAE
ncbi:divergent polysaccharide deacetylase family protein [Pseudooctadecabacter sp.]|uniref:divergent polysaccharide deacetylase family protein n=1 Tax=Pseudooctadecabacter sp. TaxID=1966338 RepID=UPI0035C79296